MSDGAFRAFVEARWPALVRFAWTLVGDQGHAEDLVQVALERTWRRWSHVRPDGAEAYVRAAVVNLAISGRRRRRFAETPLGPQHDRPTPSADRAGDLTGLVLDELRALPPRMRAVVVLRFLEDLSETQTAELLGCSAGTVKSQSARAIRRLRQRPALRDLLGAPSIEELT